MKRIFLHKSIALRLVVAIIPITLLGILIIGSSAYYITKQYVIKTIKQDINTLGFEASQNIANYFNQRKNDLLMLSEEPLFFDYFKNSEYGLVQEAETYRKGIEQFFVNFSKRTGSYNEIYFLTPEGKIVCFIKSSIIQPPQGMFHHRSLISQFRELPPGNFFMSSLIEDTRAAPTVYYAHSFYGKSGGYPGIIVLGCNLTPIQETLERLRASSSGVVYLAGTSNTPIFPPVSPENQFINNKKNTFSLSSNVTGTPWRVVVWTDVINFIKPLNRIRSICTLLIVLCGFSAAVLIYLRIRFLMYPIKELVKITEKLSAGYLSGRVKVRGTDEIANLSRSFNTMAETLEIKARENALLLDNIRVSEEKYRSLVNNSLDAIIGADADLRIATWGCGASNLFQYDASEILGQPVTALFSKTGVSELITRVKSEGILQNYEIGGIRKDGEEINLNLTWAGSSDENTRLKEWSIVIRDVTEQKRLQAQLLHAEKLSVVGRLIAGVAHEINNPLTAVVGYSELLASEEDIPSRLKEELVFVHESAIRCRDIVGNLLRFARKGKIQKNNVNVNDVIRSALKLMEYRLVKTESIQTQCRLDEKIHPVFADFHQLEQVIVNLVQNACDALSEITGPRKISIKTHETNDEIRIYISDNGPGIPPKIREKVFEPFFTSKVEGKGTGLGLAICHDILLEHGGTITIDDAADSGTCFRINLPVSRKPNNEKGVCPINIPLTPNQRILLVDDEADIIPLMRQILVDDGHHVEVATSGKQAMKIIKDKKFDLVISDIEMGSVSGYDLFLAMKKQGDAPAILFITGDLLNSTMVEKLTEMNIPYLSKPFSSAEFQLSVRKTLSDKKSTIGSTLKV